MALQYEDLGECKIKTVYTADSNTIDEKYNEVINQIQNSKINIPGFRPGKARSTAAASATRRMNRSSS